MEAFALYLLKSSVWLTGFAAVYFLFLWNERFFALNRIFLLSGIVFSIFGPFFTWHYTVVFPVAPAASTDGPHIQAIGAVTDVGLQPKELLLYIYLLGALYLIYRLIKQTTSVWQVIRKSETLHFNSVKLIHTNRYPASFSFFSFVFVNPSTHEHEINEIVNHEQEHIRQRHWIDLLLFEIVCTLQWFNPVAWIYGRFIRQNHEFLADEQALRRSPNPAFYRAALLNQMFGVPVISLANSFNYSINKKRFNMMKQITYSPFRKLKLLLVLPLIAGVFYAFAAPEYKFVQTEGNNEVSNLPQNLKTVKGKVIKEDGSPLQGTSIVVSGSTIGTMPDENGNFKLEVPDDSPIVFSFVGFESVKVKPDFDKEMVITMKRVVISIEAIGNKPSDSEIFRTSGPVLTFVDGKETSEEDFKKIKPDQIESISVLRKKEFTDKYGEKGKNGVILIKTRKDESASQDTPTDVMVNGYANDQGENTKEKPNSKIKFRNIGTSGTGNYPLLVLDGVIAEDIIFGEMDTSLVKSANVIKGEMATKKYGEKGKNGVIEITTKKGSGSLGMGSKPLVVINGEIATNQNIDKIDPNTIQSMSVWKGEKAIEKYGDQGKNGVIEIILKEDQNTNKKNENSGVKIRSTGTAGTPLMVVDGVVSSKKVEDFDPETIQSINVLKGEMATKKYGDKGKDGVLEITLKKISEVFVVVEQMPEFPGGLAALKEFVRVNLQYPKIALENRIAGQVHVQFNVAENGSVIDAKVVGGIDPALDHEALRIVNSMPKWIPGQQRGTPVKVSYVLPINFNYPADFHPKSQEKLKEMKTK